MWLEAIYVNVVADGPVRYAKYGSAFLNRQYITILWTLGVNADTFVTMQNSMIEELDV